MQRGHWRRCHVTAGIAALAAALPGYVFAQTSSVGTGAPKTVQALPRNPSSGGPAQAPSQRELQQAISVRPQVPEPGVLLALIRSTVIALNQANQTGNYTVLRDLAAPDFRNGNDASRLGAIFQVLREQSIDLTPLLNISPEVSQAPAVGTDGLLRLTGFFPTEPLRVNFDLSFQAVENRWRPYTISVYLARLEAHLEVPVLKPKAPEPKLPGNKM